jgi:hypothetical protein
MPNVKMQGFLKPYFSLVTPVGDPSRLLSRRCNPRVDSPDKTVLAFFYWDDSVAWSSPLRHQQFVEGRSF